MALTLGFTSMDQATETALAATFSEAIERFPRRFTLTDSDAADYVIIDMDSLYGPMGWLRLHAAGKHVIGLTAAARTQADFRLGRPFDTDAMVQLLQEIADAAGPATDPQAEAEATVVEPVAEAKPAAPPEPIPLAVRLAVPAAAEDTAAVTPAPADVPATPIEAPDVPDVALEPEPEPEPEPTYKPEPELESEPQPEPEPAPPPRDPVFADWMAPGALQGRLRFSRDNGPELWIDADARQYHGPRLLKPLTRYFEGTVDRADFSPVDEATWNSGSAAAGPAQPLQRLQWLGGLLAGQGTLLPGHDPDGRYRLTKWQQTEREFARHFRIATAMMKGPVTLAEIIEASGAETGEVADFLNANLATGFAEFVPEPEPEAEAPPRPTGFFRRLRSRS